MSSTVEIIEGVKVPCIGMRDCKQGAVLEPAEFRRVDLATSSPAPPGGRLLIEVGDWLFFKDKQDGELRGICPRHTKEMHEHCGPVDRGMVVIEERMQQEAGTALPKEQACPWCKVVGGRATQLDGQDHVPPSPGDLSICHACGGFLRFTDGLRIRKVDADEFEGISPLNKRELLAAQHFVRTRRTN